MKKYINKFVHWAKDPHAQTLIEIIRGVRENATPPTPTPAKPPAAHKVRRKIPETAFAKRLKKFSKSLSKLWTRAVNSGLWKKIRPYLPFHRDWWFKKAGTETPSAGEVASEKSIKLRALAGLAIVTVVIIAAFATYSTTRWGKSTMLIIVIAGLATLTLALTVTAIVAYWLKNRPPEKVGKFDALIYKYSLIGIAIILGSVGFFAGYKYGREYLSWKIAAYITGGLALAALIWIMSKTSGWKNWLKGLRKWRDWLIKAALIGGLAWLIIYGFGFLVGMTPYENIQITWIFLSAIIGASLLVSWTGNEYKTLGRWVMGIAVAIALAKVFWTAYVQSYNRAMANAPEASTRTWTLEKTCTEGGTLHVHRYKARIIKYDPMRQFDLVSFDQGGQGEQILATYHWDKRLDREWGTWMQNTPRLSGQWQLKKVTDDLYDGYFSQVVDGQRSSSLAMKLYSDRFH